MVMQQGRLWLRRPFGSPSRKRRAARPEFPRAGLADTFLPGGNKVSYAQRVEAGAVLSISPNRLLLAANVWARQMMRELLPDLVLTGPIKRESWPAFDLRECSFRSALFGRVGNIGRN